MSLQKDFEHTSGSVFMLVDQTRVNSTEGIISVKDEQSAFAVMDGNYANRLAIIVLNESLQLPNSKSILSVQTVTTNKKSVNAIVYKIINWSTTSHKPC